MDEVYTRFNKKDITTAQFIAVAEEVSGRKLGGFIGQWIEREGLPAPEVKVAVAPGSTGDWTVRVDVAQPGEPYHLLGSVDIECGPKAYRRAMEIKGGATSFTLRVPEKPTRVVFNAGNDFPVANDNFYVLSDFIEDFHNTLIVYGTARQDEANHTMALRWQETVADAYVEILPPLRKDCEITPQELASHDLFVMGQPQDNTLMRTLDEKLPQIEFGKNFFRWYGMTFARPDDGMILVLPNPYNPKKVLYLFVANSAMQLYEMTKRYSRDVPSWAIYRGDRIVASGFHQVERYVFDSFE